MSGEEKVRDGILEYYEQVLKKREQKFCPHNDEADRLVKEDPAAFLFAVILDQGAQAERMWEIPYHLKNTLGHLDINRIAQVNEDDFYKVFERLPKKPRYWRTASRRIRSAAQQIIDRYQGQAGNIWNDNPRAGDLQSRFEGFNGIGQKKAAMATRILGMDLNVPIRSWDGIDIAVDEMIQRVFPRAGLSDTNGSKDIIDSARRLNPSFPGALDYPCWEIGRTWCAPADPDCNSCYIGSVCPKIGIRQRGHQGSDPPLKHAAPPSYSLNTVDLDKGVHEVTIFIDDDAGYLNWLNQNPSGFVVNCNRSPQSDYLVLHKATCSTITGHPARGQAWTGDYIKVCSLSKQELSVWAMEKVGGELRCCKICSP